MSRLNLIETGLKELDGGSFQKLAEAYAYRKLRLQSITALGSQPGTSKPTKGIPDAHSLTDCEAILIPFTTAQCNSFQKLEKDIKECISTRVPEGYRKRIVCCHLVWRLTPEQEGQLKKLHPCIELLGPKTIATDLTYRYQYLAADFLHVPVGNGSLVTPDEWVRREERRGYATPQSGMLRYREGELKNLKSVFERVQVIVLYGPSGNGKTRLALEFVNCYAGENQIDSYVLSEMHGVGAAEDVNAFLSEGDAILLVDDAQQSDGLNAVLEAAVKNEGLRIVLTVRDYAHAALVGEVRRSVKYEKFCLGRLDDENICAVLKDDYGIVHPVSLERIRRVARGNMRLAIMAASCAKRDGYSGIESAHEIMDLFYGSLVDNLEEEDLTLLSYLSIYAPCDFREGDPAYDSLLSEGLSESSIKRRAKILHDRAILDLIESPDGILSAKFEQLNLQDFCIYKAIFERHIIRLFDFISQLVLHDKAKVIRILNVLTSIFGDNETISRIKEDCRKVWRNSQSKDGTDLRKIMSVLHPLIPDEAYRYAVDEVSEMRASDIPLSERGDYGKQVVGDASVSLVILCELKNFECYPNATSTLLDGVEKGCFELEDYKSIIQESLAITEYSVMNKFEHEQKLLDELKQKTIEKPNSPNLQYFGLKLCEQYLAFSHTSTKVGEEGSIHYINIEMPRSEPALDLRNRAIDFLCSLLRSSIYKIDAAIALRPHVGVYEKKEIGESFRPFLESGIQKFISTIPAKYVPTSKEELELFYYCSLACEALCMSVRQRVSAFLPPAYFDYMELMKSSGPDEEKILLVTKEWVAERYEDVLRISQGMWGKRKLDSYSAGSLVDRVFIAILARDSSSIDVERTFEFFCNLYGPDKEISLGPVIVERIARRIGFRQLLNHSLSHGLAALMTTGISVAPSELLTEDDLDYLITMGESGQILMRIDDVMNLESKSTGFARSYCTAAKQSLLSKPEYAHLFFLPLYGSNDSTTILDTCFRDSKKDLLEVYETNIGNDHFDYFGVVFRYLGAKGINPVDCLIKHLEAAEGFDDRRKIIRRMGQVSHLPNPKEKMHEAINRLVSCSKFPTHDVVTLLRHNDYLAKDFDVPAFIFDELECGLDKGCVPEYYNIALSDIPFRERMGPYTVLLSRDQGGKLLGMLPFGSSSYVGSGEQGFAPTYYEEIEIIKSIWESLPKNSCFSFHRKHLQGIIRAKEQEIEQERWRSFHESI